MCVRACLVAAVVSAPCAVTVRAPGCRLLLLAASCPACRVVGYVIFVDSLVRVWPPCALPARSPVHLRRSARTSSVCVCAHCHHCSAGAADVSMAAPLRMCSCRGDVCSCMCECNYVTLSPYPPPPPPLRRRLSFSRRLTRTDSARLSLFVPLTPLLDGLAYLTGPGP